jgi:ceramide glucosyltransferase
MLVKGVLLALVAAGLIYWLVAWWGVRWHFRVRHKPDPAFTPPVSVLKPVRGVDDGAFENFASFCRQDYPEHELLLGVADATDPVIPVIQRLQARFPDHPIQLIIAAATGANRKASLLHHLAARARHDLLVVSDSDMRVTPDYLKRVTAPLASRHVGLVTCTYRGQGPSTVAGRLEALHMGVAFLPSAIVGNRLLRQKFATGATSALHRRELARIGGFAKLADWLADDYQLGARVGKLGLDVHLSDYVVPSILGDPTLRELWDREVRWSRCIRVSRPLQFPGLLLTMPTPMSLLLLIASGFSPLGWAALGVSLFVRWLAAWLITGYTGDLETRRWLPWLPIRDLMSFLVWCAGVVGRCVVWRGEKYFLCRDGRMRPESSPADKPSPKTEPRLP